jgi:hypothetical protein
MMINAAIQQASGDLINWGNGGYGGDSLIISDPEKYIKDQGLLAVKETLNQIPEDSVYGASIFKNLYKRYQATDGSSVEERLLAITKSEVPGLVQKNLCSDADLTRIAKEDIENTDGSYSVDELNKRKAELYDYACKGDSSDPEQQKKLQDLADQRPSITGWDGWLALTGGDNAYSKTEQAYKIHEEEKDTQQEGVKEDMKGRGAVSAKECFKRGEPASEGEDGPCLDEEVTTPSAQVNASLSNAADAGLDRLINLTEGGLTNLIATLAVQQLTKGLRAEFIDSDKKVNVTTTKTSKSSSKPDLQGDPEAKTSMLAPLLKQLDAYEAGLIKLKDIDKAYSGEITRYESVVKSGRACYDGLVEANRLSPSDPKAVSAYDIYNNRQDRIDRVKKIITPELAKIDSARTLIQETLTKLNAASSTKEISTIYSNYTYTIDSKKYPDVQAEGQRRGDYMKDKNDAKNDVDPPKDYKGTDTVKYANDQCTKLGGVLSVPEGI